MSELIKQQPLVAVGPIHGDEPLGGKIVNGLDVHPLGGVEGKIGHPEALARGVRFCTSYKAGGFELGHHIPGDIYSPDLDIRAAGELHNWLKRLKPWMALIFHSNKGLTPRSEYISVGGPVSRKSLLAVANIARLPNVVVDPNYALYDHHPEICEVEEIAATEEQESKLVDKWLELLDVIRGLGPVGMAEEVYDPEQLNFYVLGEYIWLVNKDGSWNEFVWEHIEELEQAVENVERFAPLELPEDLARGLGLHGLQLAIASWDSRSGSKVVQQAGISSKSGRPRQQIFGGYYIKVDPPRPTGFGDQVVFNLPRLP